jgi:hypothetical protein
MDARDPVRVFIGADERQPVALSVLQDSINWRSSRPVAIQLLKLDTLPIQRRGLTSFTFSRFLVPWLCRFEGSAIFMDADVLVTGDIAELLEAAEPGKHDVQVMQEQPRFEWPSVMLFNNARCKTLTPEFIDDTANKLYDFKWAKSVGTFPREWNRCVGYDYEPYEAKLYHFTQGIPVWPETKGNHQEDQLWVSQFKHANSTVPWRDLMGNSVHSASTIKKMKIRCL